MFYSLANKETDSSKVQLLPPITSPDKIFCIGLNYRDTCKELGFAPPEEPLVFSKFSSSITGPFDKIIHPDISKVKMYTYLCYQTFRALE